VNLNKTKMQATIHDLAFIALRQILRDLNVFQILALIDSTISADNVAEAFELMGVVKATAEIQTIEGPVLVSTTGENLERILRGYVPNAHTVHIDRRAFHAHSARALYCLQELRSLRKLVIMHYVQLGIFDDEMPNLQFVKIIGDHQFVRGIDNVIAMSPNLREISFLSIYLDCRIPIFMRYTRIRTLVVENCIVNHNVLHSIGKYANVEEIIFINNFYEIPRDGRVMAHKEIFDSFRVGGFANVKRLTISLGRAEFNILPLIAAENLLEISFIVDPDFSMMMILIIFECFSTAKRTILLRGENDIERVRRAVTAFSATLINEIEIKPF
jgi:hypothetical protein